MATITGFTASRMLAIENASVTSGAIDSAGRLQLKTKGGSTFDAGLVRDVAGIAIYEQRLNAFESTLTNYGSRLTTAESNKLDKNNGTASNLTSNQVRLTSTSIANLTATAHGFQIGPSNGSNLRADPNVLQSVNNGSAAVLYLNLHGGNVSIGTSSATVDVPGYLSLPKAPTAGSHSTNKTYVDGLDAARKTYVDNADSALTAYINKLVTGVSSTEITTAVDTVDKFRALAEGSYRVWGSGIALGFPSNYGFFTVTKYGTDGQVFYRQTPSGKIYIFGWNGSTNTVSWTTPILEGQSANLGDTVVNKLRIVRTDDVPSTTPAFIIGDVGGANVQIDSNEIVSMTNGAGDVLYLNADANNYNRVEVGKGGLVVVDSGLTVKGGGASIVGETAVTGAVVASGAIGGNGNGDTYFRRDGRASGTAHWTLGIDDTGEFVRSKTVYDRTNTGAINMHVTSAGTIYRTTSVRSSKVSIESAPESWADDVLKLQPRTWHDRGAAEHLALLLDRQASGESVDWENEDVPLMRRIPGFVVDEVEDAGLTDFVTYDVQGEPNGLAYDRFSAALVMLAKRQESEIQRLSQESSKWESIARLLGEHLGLQEQIEAIVTPESPEQLPAD